MNPMWNTSTNDTTNDKIYTGMLPLFREVARNRMADHKHNKDVRQEVGIRLIHTTAF
jgi:hypothetical protein